MPIDLLALAIELIAGEGLELIKDKAKRSEATLRILDKLHLKPDSPPEKNFDGVYVYTLVYYGIGNSKPKPVLEFFTHPFIKEAFQKSFESRDESILEKETENFLDWNQVGKELIELDYDPRCEFKEFREQFIISAKLTRTVHEVIVDQTLEDIWLC